MGMTNLDSLTLSGPLTVAGGVVQATTSQVTVYAAGDLPPATSTTGTDTTPVVTETYVSRVAVWANATVTGISLLNGSAVAGNVHVGLFNAAGVLVAESASTAQAGIATLQDIPFTTPYAAVGPGLYFIGVQFNNTSARFRSFPFGRFTAFKKTGETYGTFTTLTSPNSFTANLGPIALTY